MYDTIKSKIEVDRLPNTFLVGKLKNLNWAGFLWRPIQNKKSNVIGYQTELQNLNLKLYGRELHIENSLQKFYMSNNYQSFTFSQVIAAFEILNDKLPIDVYKATIMRVDIGAVINHNTSQECNRWLDCKSKLPIPMIKRNTIYGKEFRQTNNKFKVYNKTFEAKQTANIKLQEQLMRVELTGNSRFYNKRTNPIGVYTIQDLIDPFKFKLLASELLNFYKSIKKKPNLDLSSWSTKETRIYAYMNNPDTKLAMKQYHKETYKKERSQYLKLLTKHQDIIQEKIVLEKLKAKVNFAINN